MKNVENEATGLLAGAATTNITPLKPCFLFGYPFVERTSTGVNDCLLSSALYLFDGENHSLFISNDVIFISKASAERVRTKISERTGIPASSVMIAATHTHSGPVTLDYISSSNDPVVPKVDDEYVRYMEDKSIEAACLAYQNACPAKAGFLVADGTGVGTNRHDPAGPADMDVPVVVLKNLNDEMIGCMLVCHMHPTILHENSTLVSSDFPAYVRDVLQKEYFGCECPVVYFTGAAGNQSPRHVTRENTFAEAHRIGKIVADAIGRKINTGLDYLSDVSVACSQTFVDLPKRQFPDVKKAEKHRDEFLERFERLRKTSGNTQEIRTAEVDWFGAEELFYLSKLAEKGALEQVYTSCLPAEIQIFKIGDWCFVAWPGEIFIEYAKTLKKIVKNTFLITLANGELQGYIATEEAQNNGFYEASNSIFHYTSGKILVDETVRLINTKA